ncbi:hypothetical protein BDP81DRAFT_105419 [Colletotrichum phormii]|uniref:Uncharacterized protein n=1 Tax=Colletotrichum phormii TaxID=359342 RepID=A0AAI9ZHF0_9PEZI|nr:uncharacterized protein BDP81DRAFT_105419 [Colletotrichum phormii]KAK1624620.1 hypothetical protein BDP81DRAFT_105419 [Colletotrichum phormii]
MPSRSSLPLLLGMKSLLVRSWGQLRKNRKLVNFRLSHECIVPRVKLAHAVNEPRKKKVSQLELVRRLGSRVKSTLLFWCLRRCSFIIPCSYKSQSYPLAVIWNSPPSCRGTSLCQGT